MEHLLYRIIGCLTSEKDADAIRQEILTTLCQTLNASGAKWVSPEKSIEVGHHQNSNSMKLETGNSTIFLFFEDKLLDDLDLQTVTQLLAMYEENSWLRQNVQNISQESANIAEKNARLFQQLNENANRMRGISRSVVRMQEEERAKISRELHDGVGQALLAIKMQLDIISENPSAAKNINEARKLAEQTLEEVRELSRLLRPRMLDDLGLIPTMQWYVRTYSERTGIKVSFNSTDIDERLEPDVETMFFRVTQEGLNNVLKHSKATAVKITLLAQDRSILLELADNGKGFVMDSAEPNKGSGINGIRDRVILLGGEFNISSAPGEGTKLQVKLPLQQVVHHKRKKRGQN
jgi:two-component system NarL family sensor kinase